MVPITIQNGCSSRTTLAGSTLRWTSAVQAGFVLGTLASALSGLPDRFDPRVFVRQHELNFLCIERAKVAGHQHNRHGCHAHAARIEPYVGHRAFRVDMNGDRRGGE